jgi:hypothetical protein
MNYNSILSNGVKVAPPMETRSDWRSDYARTSIMIYNNIPTFEDLMVFAERMEEEFKEWVYNGPGNSEH